MEIATILAANKCDQTDWPRSFAPAQNAAQRDEESAISTLAIELKENKTIDQKVKFKLCSYRSLWEAKKKSKKQSK